MLQPQKRALIKKILESTIIRLLEVKEILIFLNPRPKSIFINLDDLLMDLKLDPDCLEIPIPRYFAEENRDYLEKRSQLVNKLFISNFNTDQPEEDEHEEMFFLELNLENAVRIIQKNERGRQGRERLILVRNHMKKKKLKDEMKNRVEEETADFTHSMNVQKVFRAFLARIYIEKTREKELAFLGMAPKPKQDEDPIAIMEKNKETRRMKKHEHLDEYLNNTEELKELVQKNEGADIEETMKEERRK